MSSIPTGGNFVFCLNFLKLLDVQKCQKYRICVENENFDYTYEEPLSPNKDISALYNQFKADGFGAYMCESLLQLHQNIKSEVVLLFKLKLQQPRNDYFPKHDCGFTSVLLPP